MKQSQRIADVSKPMNSRKASYALSWGVLIAALTLPLPISFVRFVFFRATEWYDAYPAALPGVHFAGLMLFALSVFTHVVFLSTVLNWKRDLTPVYKGVVIGSLAINVSLMLFSPYFAMHVA